MNFEVVIGIEIHCELKTKTKMFSGSKVDFNSLPNHNTNEIDLGMPGTLPSLNKRGVEQALKACLIFNAKINQLLEFDRKCYFYPDLTKGYQITQNDYPIGTNGFIEFNVDSSIKRVNIDKIVLEEDTAKLTHFDDYTLIDYNRCGTPLIEIISDASMRSAKEASLYVSNLRNMLIYADISDAKMEEGSLRCDVNVSLRPIGSSVFGTKVEVKNLNSISNIEKAIEFEIKRQSKILLSGNTLDSETRRFDEATKQTVLMRKKDGVIDYRFHTEPNITPTLIDDILISDAKKEIPLMPQELLAKYLNEYKINEVDAKIIVNDKKLSDYFNNTIEYLDSYQQVANYLISDVLAYLNKNKISIDTMALTEKTLAKMLQYYNNGIISSKHLKKIFEIVNSTNNNDIDMIMKQEKMLMINDENEIIAFINKAISNNPDSVKDYHDGKDRALKFLLGQIMKDSNGQVNPKLTNELLLKILNDK
jgi:aspartyl-tRNA(Asn)/glutamyl-tRNA(Gln) amidotransferase subunit B